MRVAVTIGLVLAAFVTASGVARAQESDLQVQNVGPSEGAYDTDLEFDVTVANLGPDAADVALSNPVPQGMQFRGASYDAPGVSCTTPEADAATGTVTCNVASLANQATVLIKLHFRIDDLAPSPTLLTSVASISTSANDTNMANDVATATVPVPAPPAADMSARAEIRYLEEYGGGPGDAVIFALGADNHGPGTAMHVLITCTLPHDITFNVYAGRGLDTSWGCGPRAGDTVTCWFMDVQSGSARGVSFIGQVPDGTADGTHFDAAVKVSYEGDPNPDNDSATISKCVQGDYCAAGPCNANVAVACPDNGDPCAACNPATGLCRSPRGTPCDDGDACSLGDRCHLGICASQSSVMCRSTTCTPRACDHATGECVQSGPTPDLPECAFPPKPRDDDAGAEGERDASAGTPHGGDAGTTAGADAGAMAIANAGTRDGGASHDPRVKTRDAGSRARAEMDGGLRTRASDGCACRVHSGASAPPRVTSLAVLGLLAALRLRRRHSVRALSARSAPRAASPGGDRAVR